MSAAAGCPAGALAAPAALGLSAAVCAWSTAPKRYDSLSKCVVACGEGGGVPACPASAAEDAWLVGVGRSGLHWLGRYQSPLATEPTAGWDYCVDGQTHSYSGFKPYWGGWPSQDDRGGEQSCAAIGPTPQGWEDISCVLPTPFRLRDYNPLPCLCLTGSPGAQWPVDQGQ